ncbi:hypothetical protein F4810DRAFT_709744 [Camillea tinctor]|nr:hypothetical protein F4810DRAFT_709744 [Camillea tinctor]
MNATLPPDPYKALGVSKEAQLPEIKSAYRKLVLKCHPDKVQDPELKEQKQIEFQRVQQAYELLINENERLKYDKLAEYQAFKEQQNEKSKNTTTPPATSNRSPKRDTPTFYDVKDASPRPTTFAKSGPSPYGRTPPRSFEDNSTPFEEVRHQARKTASYEKERPSRREEERRRRDKDDDWPREKEKEKDRMKEKERKEKAREDKERREKEKERDRREKDKKKSSPEKDRRRDSDEKRRNRQPYVEASPEADDEVFYSSSYKSDKKKSSSRRHEEPPVRQRDTSRPPVSERERKNSANMASAIQYMQRSGGLPPLARAHTFQEESFSRHPPMMAVPTPPPATGAVYPPPPKQEDITVEEDPRRPSARGSGHRMSFSKEKTHKKSSASREAPLMSDPESVPRPIPQFKKSHSNPHGMHDRVPLARANTEGYSRPVPGSLDRSQTWYPGADHNRERSRSRHGRHERAMALSEEDSDEERDHRHRHSRRTHSPVNMQGQTTIRYAVDKGKSIPVRSAYPEETTPRGYKSKGNGTRIERGMYPQPTMDAYEEDGGAYFSKVKYAPQFNENEISYANVPHSSYRAEGLYT